MDNNTVNRPTMFCRACGAVIDAEAVICPKCGCATGVKIPTDSGRCAAPQKDKTTALLLAIFLGVFGAHRFYVGKTGTAILWLLTLGFWGIGALVDVIMIATGSFTDAFGQPLYNEYAASKTNTYSPEYEEAAATPRKVRRIVLIVAAGLIGACILFYFVRSILWAIF